MDILHLLRSAGQELGSSTGKDGLGPLGDFLAAAMDLGSTTRPVRRRSSSECDSGNHGLPQALSARTMIGQH
jgi:hypothetical protein